MNTAYPQSVQENTMSRKDLSIARSSESYCFRPSIATVVAVFHHISQEGVLQRFICGDTL